MPGGWCWAGLNRIWLRVSAGARWVLVQVGCRCGLCHQLRHLHHAVALYPLRLRLRACCRRAEASAGRRFWCGLVGVLGRAGWACGVSPAGSGLLGGWRLGYQPDLLRWRAPGARVSWSFTGQLWGALLAWVIGALVLNPVAGAVVDSGRAVVDSGRAGCHNSGVVVIRKFFGCAVGPPEANLRGYHVQFATRLTLFCLPRHAGVGGPCRRVLMGPSRAPQGCAGHRLHGSFVDRQVFAGRTTTIECGRGRGQRGSSRGADRGDSEVTGVAGPKPYTTGAEQNAKLAWSILERWTGVSWKTSTKWGEFHSKMSKTEAE